MRAAFQWLRGLIVAALPAAGAALFVLILGIATIYALKNLWAWFDQEVRYSEGWAGWMALKLLFLIVVGIAFIAVMAIFIGNEVIDFIDKATPILEYLGGGA